MVTDYEYFVLKIKKLTGIDLGQYRSQQMRRRLGSMLRRSGAGNFIEILQAARKRQIGPEKFVTRLP